MGGTTWEDLEKMDWQYFVIGQPDPHNLEINLKANGGLLKTCISIPETYCGYHHFFDDRFLASVLEKTMEQTVIYLFNKTPVILDLDISYLKPVKISTTLDAVGYLDFKTDDANVTMTANIFDNNSILLTTAQADMALISLN